MTTKLTPREQKAKKFKDDLHAQGLTINDWAAENDYPVAEVYKVLSAERKGLYGRAHEIAVAVGLKPTPSK
ncbi:DNA-binding protein [Psychrobacter sp. APC 3279]|uniref:DNA-binding protein n=1 Tax=Psychrobacter sp. APC 3279 TaxID=3035189 RepID=UPI0025B3C6DA|nr:DNA-binding protein [Psychrobacter sp. APC 3279]MDN3441075.1 DNA-binding protein [Psychrobacter sp. APC 3279]